MKRQLLLVFRWSVFWTLFFLIGWPRVAVGAPVDNSEAGWVEGRLESLSLAQKLGQLLMVGIQGRTVTPTLDDHFRRIPVGGVILLAANLGSEGEVRKLATDLQTRALIDTGVPILIAVDQEGGEVDRLGHILGQKSARYSARLVGRLYDYDYPRSSKLMRKVAYSLAQRMRSIGINMNLAPVLDLSGDVQSFIYDRSYGSSPEKVTIIARDLAISMRSAGVVATGKHFPNLSDTRMDSHVDLPVVNKKVAELAQHEWKPFINLRNDLEALMVGHILLPDLDPHHPASVSVRVGHLLREKIGFRGVVITDDLRMGALKNRYSTIEAVLRAFFSGYDVMLGLWDPEDQIHILRALEKAALRNFLTEERINQSLRRILTLKFRMKNFGANGGT